MSHDLSPERQAAADEALERVKRYVNLTAIHQVVQIPHEVSDEGSESKN